MTDVHADGILDGLPLEDVKKLLDVIRGVTPFNLLETTETVLNLVSWIITQMKSMPQTSSVSSDVAQPDLSLEESLVLLLLSTPKEDDVSTPEDDVAAQSIMTNIMLKIIVKKLVAWLSSQLGQ